MVRRELMDLVKLMVPTLQQKLYAELSKKLIEVSEVSGVGRGPMGGLINETTEEETVSRAGRTRRPIC